MGGVTRQILIIKSYIEKVALLQYFTNIHLSTHSQIPAHSGKIKIRK